MKKLSIVIVHFNTVRELTRCLDSLLPQVPEAECWVVDNASVDFQNHELQQRYPAVHWMINSVNRGFAAANNQVLSQTQGKWLWFLNPDTEVPAGSMAIWLEQLERMPADVAVVGTRLVYPDGRLQLSWGQGPDLWAEAFQKWWWNRLEAGPSGSWGQRRLLRIASQPRTVDWVLGASFFVRRTAIEQVGGMDERFYMYFEEVDWCLRMRKAGWKIFYHPDLTVVHWRGRSVAYNPDGMEVAYRRSQIDFYRKHYGRWATGCLRGYLQLKYRLRPSGTKLLQILNTTRAKKGCHSRPRSRSRVNSSGNPILRSSRRMTALHDSCSQDNAMKVTLDARMLSHPGIGRYLSGLIQAFEKCGVTLELLGDPQACAAIDGPYPKTVRLARSPIYSLQEHWEMFRAVRGAQLVHVPHFNVSWLHPRRIPLVVTLHDLTYLKVPESLSSLWAREYVRRSLRFVARRASSIIAVSEQTQKDFCEAFRFPIQRTTVVYSGIDSFFRPLGNPEEKQEQRWRLRLPERYLLWVSSIKPHKDFPTLLAAFRRLQEKGLPHHLVVVGRSGPRDPALPDLLKAADIRSGVRWYPWVAPKELVWFYNLAEAFVFPSRSEGFGFPPLEAMACGLPVVAAHASCLPEVLGEAAIWFSPGNVDELVGKLYNVLFDQELRRKQVDLGVRQAARYSWDETARKTHHVYERALNSDGFYS